MELPAATGVDLPPADPAPTVPEDAGSVTVDRLDDHVLVVLVGEIDVEMKDELFDALQEAARHGVPVTVDCSAVLFIDSTGISGLAWLANLAAEPPCLVAVPQVMYELLQLTGMEHVFRFAT
ncbi:STAS domain-containing protein [Actinotalea sp. Marseille-Q4924]|uniref:STAS domain-containing protein n=1 Tax=Actinotalea sp. Marseille-Q4924 TaxID=2866571 RepID=UPI001CE4331C|nr:STAS domain-containing protein [Actinotalea sp. Marseille-Q4924]